MADLALRVMLYMGMLRLFLLLVRSIQAKRDESRQLTFPYLRLADRSRYHIVMYHRVNNESDEMFGGVPVHEFAAQMEALQRYYRVLPLDELVERSAARDVPPNALAITFDDGYEDNYQHAFPILRRYSLPATIFLVSGSIETGTPLWHDVVFELFRRTSTKALKLGEKVVSLRALEDKRKALSLFLDMLRRESTEGRDRHISTLSHALAVPLSSVRCPSMLTWEQIGEMAKHGITFGAHTVTHPILSRIPLNQAVQEIELSRRTIEDKLGVPANLFAYPNGGRDDFTEPLQDAIKEMGFTCAVTTIWGTNTRDTNRYELRRMWCWDSNGMMCALKLGWHKFCS